MPDRRQMPDRNIHEIRMNVGNVQAFGLECRLLCEEHLPLLSSWRNHPDVLPFMRDTRKVTPDILLFWFRRISRSDSTIYHVVFRQNEPVGFTGLNHIDWKNHTYEGEIFLNPEYIGQKLGVNILLCRELIVKKLGLKTAVSAIRTENKRSIFLTTKLAYECTGTNNGFNFYRSECHTRRKALRTVAREKGMEDEFILHFGQESGRHTLSAFSVSDMKQAETQEKQNRTSD